jgi:hypothetical protein
MMGNVIVSAFPFVSRCGRSGRGSVLLWVVVLVVVQVVL